MSSAVDQHTLRPLVTGRSAWIGADLAKRPDEWTYRLSPSETAEIEAATAKVLGHDIATIARAEFPLPTLGPVLDRLRDEVLNGRGFVLLRGLPVADRPIEESATAYWGIGTYFGNARSQNAKGHVLGHVRDLGLSSKDPNVRIYQTTERQNFHTNFCDIVSLLCLKTAKSGGLSSLTSSMSVYNVDGAAASGPGVAAVPADADRPARRGARGQAPMVRDADLQRAYRVCCRRSMRRTTCVRRSVSRRASSERRRHRGARLLRCAGRGCGTAVSTWSSSLATCSSCTITRCCMIAPRLRTGRSRSASAICCGFGLRPRRAAVAAGLCRNPVSGLPSVVALRALKPDELGFKGNPVALKFLDLREHPVEGFQELDQVVGYQEQAETKCRSFRQSFTGDRESDRREPFGSSVSLLRRTAVSSYVEIVARHSRTSTRRTGSAFRACCRRWGRTTRLSCLDPTKHADHVESPIREVAGRRLPRVRPASGPEPRRTTPRPNAVIRLDPRSSSQLPSRSAPAHVALAF